MKRAKGESSRKPNWLELPIDLMKNILQRLDTVEIVTSARNVCPLWWNICKDPLMWRAIDTSSFHIILFNPHCLEQICRCAINLSSSHLEDFAILAFGTDDLLKYIAHRASYLRRLQISNCNGISNTGLEEFVKKFSLLEELDISFDKYLSKRSLEAIGRCCPSLKSLKLDIHCYFEAEFADQVFAIAKIMPGLRHLAFSGICIGNNELVAILDGCPLLDSLHLQNCVHYRFSQSLDNRFHQQIKDLQLPYLLYDDDDDDDNGLAYVDTFEDTYANDDWEY